MVTEVILAALFFTLLGAAYVKGYDIVKKHSPEHLVHFYLIMATARMLLVATVLAVYVLAVSHSREESIRFALIYIIMYIVMMAVTLRMRH